MTGWFMCPYKRRAGRKTPTRYCAMDDFTKTIRAAGGDWHEAEIDGDQAIVLVDVDAEPVLDELALAFRWLSEADARAEWAPRKKPRYDKDMDSIVCDGALQPTRLVDDLKGMG